MPSLSDGCRSRVYFTTNILSNRTCGRLLCVYGKSSVSRCSHITGWRTRRWSSISKKATCCDVRTIHRNRFTIWWSSAGTGDRLTGLHFAQSTRPSTASGRNWRPSASQTAFRYAFGCECNNDGNNQSVSFLFTIAHTVSIIYGKTKISLSLRFYISIYKNILLTFFTYFETHYLISINWSKIQISVLTKYTYIYIKYFENKNSKQAIYFR